MGPPVGLMALVAGLLLNAAALDSKEDFFPDGGGEAESGAGAFAEFAAFAAFANKDVDGVVAAFVNKDVDAVGGGTVGSVAAFANRDVGGGTVGGETVGSVAAFANRERGASIDFTTDTVDLGAETDVVITDTGFTERGISSSSSSSSSGSFAKDLVTETCCLLTAEGGAVTITDLAAEEGATDLTGDLAIEGGRVIDLRVDLAGKDSGKDVGKDSGKAADLTTDTAAGFAFLDFDCFLAATAVVAVVFSLAPDRSGKRPLCPRALASAAL